MSQKSGKIVIIGGGIAGLCTAVYAQECGYQAEVLEMHTVAGGLATNWRRGDYTFETCLHWLLGSNPSDEMHARWQEVFDIDKLTFVYPEELVRIETEGGENLRVFSNIDRLEAEFLRRAPEDAGTIVRFADQLRQLSRFKMPDMGDGWIGNLSTLVHDLPSFPLLHHLSRISCKEYGKQFNNPLVRSFFGSDGMAELSAVALLLSLAWRSGHKAGYAIGGSQAIIQAIAQRLRELGGKMRLGAKVERVLVESDTAVGVQLNTGETISADWVISAADSHATIFQFLEGKYRDKSIERRFDELETFPSYLQVSLGVARDLSNRPGLLTRLLDTPLDVDPGTELPQVSFRIFHFDSSFAPAGKTAVTCFLPTYNFHYWTHLKEHDPETYRKEKDRVAGEVIAILERCAPEVHGAIEVNDVSTPATVIHYTGNWRGSMEGWLLTPGTAYRPLTNSLSDLRRFLMAGQWILPGGGLPSGLLTARAAIQAVCRQDRKPFSPRLKETPQAHILSHS